MLDLLLFGRELGSEAVVRVRRHIRLERAHAELVDLVADADVDAVEASAQGRGRIFDSDRSGDLRGFGGALVFEAISEDDPGKLRAELVQSAAVIVQWNEAMDRRAAASVGEAKIAA